jgi:tetratricopeptide (TPR) repeat protein
LDSSTSSNREVSQNELEEYNEAIADYIKAIDLDLTDAIAYCIRGNARYNLGQYNEAIADYTKAIELNPTYAIAYNNRGLAQKT